MYVNQPLLGEESSSRRSGRRIIKSFEARAMKKRPFTIKVADYLSMSFGSIEFLIVNFIAFIAWIVLNSGIVPGFVPFDPYPFTFLIMLVSLEAIFLTTIVLMSQNRQSFITSLRDELDMQVNVLTEREITKALEILIHLHNHLDMDDIHDPELESMLKATNLSYIERKLEEQLKGEQPKLASALLAGNKPKKPGTNGNGKKS
jgi:uncharacterized membrane protein